MYSVYTPQRLAPSLLEIQQWGIEKWNNNISFVNKEAYKCVQHNVITTIKFAKFYE